MLNPFRYCGHVRRINSVITISSNVDISSILAHSRNYAKDKGSCCKDVSQTEGKKIQEWPTNDPPPPAWRVECPYEPQPPNYDPYRIKVPDIMVPPLPPSNAKWNGVVFTVHQQPPSGHEHGYQQQGQQYPGQQEQYSESEEQEAKDEPGSQGLFGYLKSLFGRGKKSGKTEGEAVPREDQEVFSNPEITFGSAYASVRDLFHNSPIIHPDCWKEPKKRLPNPENDVQDPLPRLGYHGRQKYKYAFHEPWKPLDRLTLLAQAEKDDLAPVELDKDKQVS